VLESFDSKQALKFMRSGLRAASKPVLLEAKRRAPELSGKAIQKAGLRDVVPGALKESIHLKQLPISKLRKSVIVLLSLTPATWYGRILEFGQGQLKGRKMAFMRPAADNNKMAVLQLYKEELRKRINRFVKRQRRGR